MAVYLIKSWWRQRWYNFLFLQSNGQQRGQKSQINYYVRSTSQQNIRVFFVSRPLSSFSQWKWFHSIKKRSFQFYPFMCTVLFQCLWVLPSHFLSFKITPLLKIKLVTGDSKEELLLRGRSSAWTRGIYVSYKDGPPRTLGWVTGSSFSRGTRGDKLDGFSGYSLSPECHE